MGRLGSDLVNVRFAPLCGLNSDISRGPRGAISGCKQLQQGHLFDHLVGDGQYPRRECDPECSGGLEVDNELERGRLHYR